MLLEHKTHNGLHVLKVLLMCHVIGRIFSALINLISLLIPFHLYIDISCPSISVQHTNHWRGGNTGAYFYFDEDAFTEMIGNADWPGHTFVIKQTGSQDWTGNVKVWAATTSNGGAHGRRGSGKASGQWAADDRITLGGCGRYTE